jgi:hypothetical protein
MLLVETEGIGLAQHHLISESTSGLHLRSSRFGRYPGPCVMGLSRQGSEVGHSWRCLVTRLNGEADAALARDRAVQKYALIIERRGLSVNEGGISAEVGQGNVRCSLTYRRASQ